MLPFKPALFASSLLFAALPAAAQLPVDSSLRQTLNETVVTGVSAPVKMQNALSQYRVISKEAMRAQGAITVADALVTQLNLNIGNDRALGANITMQGLGGDKVKILIDGLPVNGRENGNVDLGQLSLNNVARIEIVQGPMSVRYGSDALGGVINIITNKRKAKTEASAGFNWEDIGRYNVDATANFRIDNHHSIQAGGGRNYFGGYGWMDTMQPQRARVFKPKEQWLANVGYQYVSDSGFQLQFASDFIRETLINRGAVIGWPYSASATDEYYYTTRSNNRLILGGRLGKGLWKLENGYALYHRIRESRIKDLLTLNESASPVSGSQDTSRFDDITLRSNYASSAGRLRYDGGYELLFQRAQSGKFGDSSYSADNYALYGNAAMDFFDDRLTAQLGLRGTYNTVYTTPLIYSLNLLYKPADRLQLRASYANGFRAPSLKEQYLQFVDQNHNVIGNPDLKPEHGHHAQASASWQLKAARAVRGGLTAIVYYNDVRDLISLANPDPNPASINRVYANIARQRNAIGTLQAEGEWKQLYALLGAGVTRTFGTDGGFDAFNAFEATANARYFIKPAGVNINLFYKYTGGTRQLSAMPDGGAIYDVELPAFSMMDLSATRRFFKGHLDLTAGVKNVFDVKRLTPTGTLSTGPHTSGGGDLLPRRVFVTARVGL